MENKKEINDGRIEVTIRLLPSHARWLRSMASLGRSIDAIGRVISDGLIEPKKEVFDDDLNEVITLLNELKLPLRDIHGQIREQLVAKGIKPLWDQNQK